MADETQEQELNLLEKIMTEGKLARDDSQKAYARDLLSEFIDSVIEEGTAISDDTVAMVNAKIAELDALISDQLNEVLHHEDFQDLEATWRGMNFLVMNTETGTQLKLRVMNVSKKDLLTDLEKAVEFDQSALFKMVYEEEYGTFGGHPYSCLVGDYRFGRHPQDMALLEKLSNLLFKLEPRVIGAESNLHLCSLLSMVGPYGLSPIVCAQGDSHDSCWEMTRRNRPVRQ